jgi:hypothetical protein
MGYAWAKLLGNMGWSWTMASWQYSLVHYRKTRVCRASKSLPCVFFGRTAKSLFAVRFFIERTAKKKRTTNKLFAVRSKKNARQRNFFKKNLNSMHTTCYTSC